MAAAALDETKALHLKFDEHGLIPAIVTDARDGAVLMFAYMNREALDVTLVTGQIHFYSRSRKVLWKKGETSGETFAAISILTDCDQDVLQIKVTAEGHGAACTPAASLASTARSSTANSNSSIMRSCLIRISSTGNRF